MVFINKIAVEFCCCCCTCRDPPESTGDEPDDFEYEAPKIYEPVSIRLSLHGCFHMYKKHFDY